MTTTQDAAYPFLIAHARARLMQANTLDEVNIATASIIMTAERIYRECAAAPTLIRQTISSNGSTDEERNALISRADTLAMNATARISRIREHGEHGERFTQLTALYRGQTMLGLLTNLYEDYMQLVSVLYTVDETQAARPLLMVLSATSDSRTTQVRQAIANYNRPTKLRKAHQDAAYAYNTEAATLASYTPVGGADEARGSADSYVALASDNKTPLRRLETAMKKAYAALTYARTSVV